MEILILLVVLVAVLLWVKKKFPNAGLTKYIDIFSSRSKPSDKTLQRVNAGTIANINNDVDKKVEPEPSIGIQESHFELQPELPQNIEASPVEITNGHSVDNVKKLNAQIPEDSVLKRHYLAKLAADRKSITHPYPTDSILRRHYESLQASYLQKT